MNDRRSNQAIRDQVQKWFDALRTHLAAENAQSDVIERLQTWATVEDLLTDCPRLLPPLMTMAWKMRHLPAFAEFFQTPSGKVAAETTSPLAPSNKSFEDVVLFHLLGAMRLYCGRLEKAWLDAEKGRYVPGPLEKISWLAPLMRKVKKRKDEDILAHYPQRGLYQALKPHLCLPSQFGLIEALATLPTRTVSILGNTTRGLMRDSSIRNLAALETRKCKFVTELARAFAETVIASAEAGETDESAAARPPMDPAPLRANLPEIAGASLSHLARDGLHLAKAAIVAREHARDVVIKTAVPFGLDLWQVFSDKESVMSIAACPLVLARAIGEGAARVPRRTSQALNAFPQKSNTETVVTALLGAAGREALAKWATSPNCCTVWERLGNDFNQSHEAQDFAALTPESIAAYCVALLPKFAVLSDEGQPAVVGAVPVAEP